MGINRISKKRGIVIYRNFACFRRETPNITLDESILLFERSDKCETLGKL